MSLLDYIPNQYKEKAMHAAMAVSELDQVIVAAHVNMDGDALGSVAACGYMLKCLKREFALYSSTGVPHNLDFLQLPAPVYKSLDEIPFEPQAAIWLDCSEASRLGPELEKIAACYPSVNIDHHVTDAGLGTLYNFIDCKAAATAQLTAYTALSLGLPLEDELAWCIALGLITDTGGFCHGNTSADVFSLCALLVRNGCSISELREKLQNNWLPGRLHLWGEMLSKVELEDNGQIAICDVSLADLSGHDCAADDLEGLVEWIRKLRGVKVAALIREVERDKCKFSLRSHGRVDVRTMAAELGGGGHYNAAGGVIHAPLAMTHSLLVSIIAQHLEKE